MITRPPVVVDCVNCHAHQNLLTAFRAGCIAQTVKLCAVLTFDRSSDVPVASCSTSNLPQPAPTTSDLDVHDGVTLAWILRTQRQRGTYQATVSIYREWAEAKSDTPSGVHARTSDLLAVHELCTRSLFGYALTHVRLQDYTD